jgi:hypothetical protein
MLMIDLNADLGEGGSQDAELITLVSSATTPFPRLPVRPPALATAFTQKANS